MATQNLIDSALQTAPTPPQNLIDAANSQSSSPASAFPNLIDAAFSTSTGQSSQSPGASNTSQPGFFQRLGESLGLPTSMKQVQAAGKESISPRGIASDILGPIVDVVPGVIGYAQRVYNNIGSDLRDEYEGARNITQGGPIGPNLGKAAYGIAHGAVANLPFVGEPAESLGKDIQSGNYAGATGSAIGIAAQVLLPEALKKLSARPTATPTAPIETPAAPVAPAYAPGTPADLVQSAGLVYKGELVPGTNVHMFEDAAYPGKTAALKGTEMTSPAAIRAAMNTKLAAFGVDPASLPNPESLESLSDASGTAGSLQQPSLVQRGFEKYSDVRAHDPEIGDTLQQLDNAPKYLRAKAQNIIPKVLGEGEARLTSEQERLFTLMADTESRENLQANHPDEYQSAINDPAIQGALDRYKPYEQDLSAAREALGGKLLDGDYLARIYQENTGERIPGTGQRRIGIQDENAPYAPARSASSEYFYQNGTHEFEPSFAPKYVATNLRLIRDQLIDNFQAKATKLERGQQLPDTINYAGREYQKPDLSPNSKATPLDYSVFDTDDGRYIGPKSVVSALRDYEPVKMKAPGAIATKFNAVRDFMQQQIFLGGAGIPHKINILRRIASEAPMGIADPRGWANAYKVLTDEGLRARGISGLNDPTFNSLVKNGALTAGEMVELKRYWGGNFNPANWTKFGHESLFGPGGMDQRGRLWLADRIRADRPSISDAAIAREINTTLGSYNRANWTETQKALSHFMLFPGWDTSSMHYVLQHPIKSVVPSAMLNLVANQTLSRLGKQNDPEDAYDPFAIHVGNHSLSTSLTREPMAIHLAKPLWAAAIEAKNNPVENGFSAARAGLQQGIREAFHLVRPDLSGLVALGVSAAGMDMPGVTVFTKKDTQTPGTILSNKALEKVAAYTILKTNPLAGRLVDGDTSHLEQKLRMFSDAFHGDKDALKQIGGNAFYGSTGMLGVYDYRRDAEQTLALRTSMSSMFNENLKTLTKRDPEQAARWVQNPQVAAYLMFHNDFASLSRSLKQLDDAYDHAKTDAERGQIETARKGLLANSELLNDAFMHTESDKALEKAKADADASNSKSGKAVKAPTARNNSNLIDAAIQPSGQDKKADYSYESDSSFPTPAPPAAPTPSPAFRLAQHLSQRRTNPGRTQ